MGGASVQGGEDFLSYHKYKTLAPPCSLTFTPVPMVFHRSILLLFNLFPHNPFTSFVVER